PGPSGSSSGKVACGPILVSVPLWAPWVALATLSTLDVVPLHAPRPRVESRAETREEEERECLRFHEVSVGEKDDVKKHKQLEKYENVVNFGFAVRPSGKMENVCGGVWHFITNPRTEACGPTGALLEKLKKLGVTCKQEERITLQLHPD